MTKYALVTGACINTGVAIVEKFASEGWNVVFTGRSPEKVQVAEKEYKARFADVNFFGVCIDSLIDERTVDEKAVEEMFLSLDEKGIFVDSFGIFGNGSKCPKRNAKDI